jgi:5-formyltetrahydrofolate cyclo-ligase
LNTGISTEDKKQLRLHLRAQRKNIVNRIDKERAINASIAQFINQRQPKIIASYQAFDGEPLIDIPESMQALSVVYPKISAQHTLIWIKPNAWIQDQQYPQLLSPLGDCIPLSSIEMILTPLVGFDRQGNRLGMGGGYYDRCLADPQRKAITIGIAFECQGVPDLKPELWDQALDMVITEVRCDHFKK